MPLPVPDLPHWLRPRRTATTCTRFEGGHPVFEWGGRPWWPAEVSYELWDRGDGLAHLPWPVVVVARCFYSGSVVVARKDGALAFTAAWHRLAVWVRYGLWLAKARALRALRRRGLAHTPEGRIPRWRDVLARPDGG